MNSVQNPPYQAGMEARFAIAARHSRMVRFLRIAVPAAVALSMAAILFVSIYNPFRMLLPKLPVDIGNLVVSGTKITMESPHMSGYTPDQRPYEVWAKTATQDLTVPDRVALNTLRAKVLMEDRTTQITLDARDGVFDSKTQLLDLHKDIFLQSSTGYEARLSQALVDIGKSTVTSEEHVDVKLLNGTLSADRLRITGGGEVVRFEGNVVMNLVMDSPEAAPREPEPVAQPKTRSVVRSPPTRNDPDDEVSPRSISTGRIAHFACTAACVLALLAGGEAGAQSAVQGVPNAMQGFSQNRDQPIQIEAASLEMRDKKKEATFAGNVKVVQGDTIMTSKTPRRVLRFDLDARRQRRRPPMRRRRNRRRCRPRPRSRRQFVDPKAGGQGQCGGDPEGPGGDRRDRRVRHQGQHDHHARRHRADPGQERAARRPADGGHDDGRLAGGIR